MLPQSLLHCMNPPASFLAVPPTVRLSILMVGMPTPTGHGLSVFTAGADAFVEFEVVADH